MASKDTAAAAPEKKKRFAALRQIPTVYKAVKGFDPQIGWWMLGVFLLILGLSSSASAS
jgi:hypothetical protein